MEKREGEFNETGNLASPVHPESLFLFMLEVELEVLECGGETPEDQVLLDNR